MSKFKIHNERKRKESGGSVSIGTKNLQHELLSKDKPELF